MFRRELSSSKDAHVNVTGVTFRCVARNHWGSAFSTLLLFDLPEFTVVDGDREQNISIAASNFTGLVMECPEFKSYPHSNHIVWYKVRMQNILGTMDGCTIAPSIL